MFRHHMRIGILKGGQLGRMLIRSCMDFGLQSYVMDNDVNAPCRHYCTDFTPGDVLNFDDVYRFGKKVDLLTLEFEHINIDALVRLQEEGLKIYPDPKIIRLVQDKGQQKEFYRQHGFPTADFVLINGRNDLLSHAGRFPLVQKSRTAGYDGKGVHRINSMDDVKNAMDVPSVLENYVAAEKEISVIVARNPSGETAVYPIVEMDIHPQAYLLDFLVCPARISERTARRATEVARDIAHALGIVGVMAVEMFVTSDGEILVNEISPRPHNSGHHTIEASVTSQFEQHLRAVLDLPLGSTDMKSASVMINLTGEPGHRGPARYIGVEDVLRKPDVHVHLYGKSDTSPFRKMGHITVLADQLEKAIEEAQWIKNTVKVVV